MKKFQSNSLGKACAALVLLSAVFGMAVGGVWLLISAGSVLSESWQDCSQYSLLLEKRRWELENSIQLQLELNRLERQVKTGESSALLHADIEAIGKELAAAENRLSQSNTWFRFRVLSESGEMLGTNLGEEESIRSAVESVFSYTMELDGRYLYEESVDSANEHPQPELPAERLLLEYGVSLEVDQRVQDEFCAARQIWEDDRLQFTDRLTGFFSLGGLALAALAWGLWSAGHKNGQEEIALTWQERIWFDLYAVTVTVLGGLMMFGGIGVVESLYWGRNSSAVNQELQTVFDLGVAGAGALFAGSVMCAALLLRTLAVRLKAGKLRQTTLVCRLASGMAGLVQRFALRLPVTWKVILAFAGYVMVSVWLFGVGGFEHSDLLLLLFCLCQLAAAAFLAWWADSYQRLRQGTRTIAKGDLEYQINVRHMPYDLRLQAEDLNNISAGLSAAVDEKMKSERFKAELITNVSHDLKTPLTSIINYVSLLKSTEQTDPKAAEYIEVLERKSQRLKKLTEDLVEASKASTGALSVSRERIDAGQLLDQALGEWEEKLEARRLTVVKNLPEGETWVYADGRHLWRVLDNLLSNCAKYAMEGTRVYLDLERGKGQVAVSVKNISREQLNVPPERLMERFVRGEESRSTEGSGLGLSIARSLTELQGGTFGLMVDGDLFKAVVTLPQAS